MVCIPGQGEAGATSCSLLACCYAGLLLACQPALLSDSLDCCPQLVSSSDSNPLAAKGLHHHVVPARV